MPEFSNTVISLFTVKRGIAPEQGGLLTGKDPTAFNPSDPLRLWIVQVGVIIMMSQLLALGLRRIRQPKVIAEVIGGIFLGPTVFGRIPGFTKHIFPQESRPYLSLVANIGLCLFLFLVGLEIDAAIIRRNARLSLTVALAGMVVPFGFGAALAVPLYSQFIDKSIKFTYFMLFTGVAYSITAFPVLCRILTELKLLDTTVGIVVLSAGVGNDIVGWTLLALSVALVNAGSGLTALWILMTCVGWTLFLLFPIKWAMKWLARETGSIENGPTMFFMTITILLLFGSAFFTDVIGVHAIFGAFIAGLIIPREGGLAITLTEKLEDMVAIIFLPLYFTLSGLSTDLGLLNNGITWAYTAAICSLAFIGKFGGCTLAAKYFAGFSWRESSTIGSLMSCKGLVELIVLNVGLSAGILSQRVFSMFVLEALLLTFMTTPLVTLLYPPHIRKRVSASGVNFDNVVDGAESQESSERNDREWKTKFIVVLDKIDHVPGMMAITQLFKPQTPVVDQHRRSVSGSPSLSQKGRDTDLLFDVLRLIELSDRTSAVMKSSAADSLLHSDPLLGIFRMFGELNNLPMNTSLSIVPFDAFPNKIADHAWESCSDMIFVPWLPPVSLSDRIDRQNDDTTVSAKPPATNSNPFDGLFKANHDKAASASHTAFIRGVFAQSKTDVALFIDQGRTFGSVASRPQHLFLPFFGGPDDRLALEFIVQICMGNSAISATVIKLIKSDPEADPVEVPREVHLGGEKYPDDNPLSTIASVGIADTVYGNITTHIRMQSETADNVTWSKYASPTSQFLKENSHLTGALSRIEFSIISSSIPVHTVIDKLTVEKEVQKRRSTVVTGRSRRMATEDHKRELKELMEKHGSVGPEVKKTIGDVATAIVIAGCGAGVIVVQSALV